MTLGDGAASMLVLDVERIVGPQASRTHVRLPFVPEREAEVLEVRFSYEPKVLADEERERALIEEGLRLYAESLESGRPREPVLNLLTLSLDGPSGFRGCAHRHNPDQSITVGRDSATPGFIAGVLEAGCWTATVSVHCVVSERCTFRVQVSVQR